MYEAIQKIDSPLPLIYVSVVIRFALPITTGFMFAPNDDAAVPCRIGGTTLAYDVSMASRLRFK